MKKPQIIAFYLPQFYPTPENDEWWEPGFTEWTNVVKAKPIFKGHYQPRIPRDLGFYDLRVPETREKQVRLAREAGVDGFCYWHYWFGNGKRLLADVFREVVETGKPDFPFCLCWANHSWYKKTWDPNMPNKLLIEQKYPGVEDYVAHFNEMLPAFQDHRYMRTEDGRLIFGIFDFDHFVDFRLFKETWNYLAKENGLVGFDFFALVQGEKRLENLKADTYDRIVYDPLNDCVNIYGRKTFRHYVNAIFWRLGRPIKLTSYSHYVEVALARFNVLPNYTPSITPMWDHSPRSGARNLILHNNSPKEWYRLCRETIKILEKRADHNDFIFIKSWNEWGEGNYMEPDSKFGKEYIVQAGKAFKK